MDVKARIKHPNLRAELSRNGIKQKDVAKLLGVSELTVSKKINGKTSFTIDEAFLIQKTFFPNFTVDYLFSDVAIYE